MMVFLLVLVGLVLIGAPLFVIVGSGTALSFTLFVEGHGQLKDLLPLTQAMEGLLKRQEFLAVPLFMASGAIMTSGGMARRLIDVARASFGWLPGGLAVASVMACMFFAAISGSSPVTLIAVGSLMLPAMVESKYPENFALGLVTTAGSLGCLVPPSISMLIYAISLSGSSASVSPEDLFLAGLIPAFFICALLSAYSIWVGRKVPEAREPFQFARLRTALRDGIWALLLPLLVLGGIYGGLFTPSEAGAAATVYALVVTMFLYRELTLAKLMATLQEGALLMGSLILIIVLAFALNDFLALIGVQEKLMALIQSLNLGPAGFLLLVNVLLVVVGALMDSISCTLVFAPLLAPVAWELYGIDPLHFGVVFVVNMEIGYLMPPVATNLFVAATTFKKPFGQVTRAVLPTLGLTLVALAVLMYVPTLSKAAVNWKTGKPLAEAFPWQGRKATPLADGVGTPAEGAQPKVSDKASDLSRITSKAMGSFDFDEEEPAADAGAK